MRFLRWFRVQDCPFGVVEFSFEVDIFLGPEFQNKVHSFAGLIDSDLVRIPFAVSLKFHLGPTRSDTENRPPVCEEIKSGYGLCKRSGRAKGYRSYEGPESDLLSLCREIRQGCPSLKGRVATSIGSPHVVVR